MEIVVARTLAVRTAVVVKIAKQEIAVTVVVKTVAVSIQKTVVRRVQFV